MRIFLMAIIGVMPLAINAQTYYQINKGYAVGIMVTSAWDLTSYSQGKCEKYTDSWGAVWYVNGATFSLSSSYFQAPKSSVYTDSQCANAYGKRDVYAWFDANVSCPAGEERNPITYECEKVCALHQN